MAETVLSQSNIRELNNNAQHSRWNTLTGAAWKGEKTLSTAPVEIASRSLALDEKEAHMHQNGENVPFSAVDVDAREAQNNNQNHIESHGGNRDVLAIPQEGPSVPHTDLAEAAEVDSSNMDLPLRQSVHFVPNPTSPWTPISPQPSSDTPVHTLQDRPFHTRNSSFISKVLALSPSHPSRSPLISPALSHPDDEAVANGRTPRAFYRRARPVRSKSANDDDHVDADTEDNAAEDEMSPGLAASRRRRSKFQAAASELTNTVKRKRSPSGRRPQFPGVRSATFSDDRLGVSEDEGRERLARGAAWRRKSSGWLHRDTEQSGQDMSDTTRPLNRRIFSNLAGGSTTVDGNSGPRRVWHEGRAHDAWQRIRSRMGMIVQKSKEEQIDQIKSAELMAELLAGSPAALILASSFQRDERDKKRIPVLLEQLKISIPSSSPLKEDTSAERHLSFHIELEYGSGLMRMKWTIDRTLRDFANLHLKYKLQSSTQKYISRKGNEDARTRLPKFPKSAFPILRQARGFGDDEEDEDETAGEGDASEALPGPDKFVRRIKRNSSSFRAPRRTSSVGDVEHGAATSLSNGNIHATGLPNILDLKREGFNTRQRKRLEQYLQQLIRYVIFRSGSNRLCRFLELSALGVRLASEGSYHGKEGTLVLQSGKGIDFRKAWRPGLLIQRHKPMWFLVRHSYLVCVDSPEEMNIYDVLLVDTGFQVQARRPRLRDQKNVHDFTKTAGHQARHPQHHVLRIQNHERKIRLLAKNERQLQQFEDSLRLVCSTTEWASKNRFDSFAPVRHNVFAQWLVDGRDYMWNVSRAISMAQDVIYIHDWWLSPEIYMRRPAAISQKWRLDRLLQRKAQEGVKIFVIVYRNINSAIPIDSEYTKFSLLDLHPNVFVQRSPNQLRQNTFFWAHHEKICIVDHVLAFCGGVDLCLGRWDTPQHTVVDDKPTGFESTSTKLDSDHCQLWPGKDYSNPRVLDFFKLDEPYGEMYDRGKVPRMPWHDIGMQIVGQPARDLSRHFVQRWNYILRQRKPSRPTPFLLPPPDFAPNEVETLGLDGTCRVQILRSACDWSIGTPHKVEHSIMNAYVRLIQASEHFVYIENQFFITSCVVEGTKIRNAIGDALVERIIRAHAAGEKWRAIILIPLMPGFQNTVDAQDGSSIRLIMQCQYRSIDRGDTSIFERLRSVGVPPEDYIEFYSLRSWGKIGPTKALVTEQLYIHAKIMVVDDRYAIIGSANINERSLLGERDSEVAAVISDTDMVDSTMAGMPYMVGRFPHTLRMRLMREHLGLDVDAIMDEEREEQLRHEEPVYPEQQKAGQTPLDTDRSMERRLMQSKHRQQDGLIARYEEMRTFNHDADWEQANNPHTLAHKKLTSDPRVTGNSEHRADVSGYGSDKMAMQANKSASEGRDTTIVNGNREVLQNSMSTEGKGSLVLPLSTRMAQSSESSLSSIPDHSSSDDAQAQIPPDPSTVHNPEGETPLVSRLPPLPASDDTDIGGAPLLRTLSQISAEVFNPLLASLRRPVVTKDCMKDPIAESFFREVWHTVAGNNTKLFRKVFRCMPDSQVANWKDYNAANTYAEKFANSQGMSKSHVKMQHEAHGTTGPPGHGASELIAPLAGVANKIRNARSENEDDQERAEESARMRSNTQNSAAQSSLNEKNYHDRPESKTEQQKHEEAVRDKDYAFTEKEREKVEEADKVDFALPEKESAQTFSEKKSRPITDAAIPESTHGTQTRRKRTTTKSSGGPFYGPDYMPNKEDAEELLKLIQGTLVEWPYDWLVQEEKGGKWLYSVDQMAPLEIYN